MDMDMVCYDMILYDMQWMYIMLVLCYYFSCSICCFLLWVNMVWKRYMMILWDETLIMAVNSSEIDKMI